MARDLVSHLLQLEPQRLSAEEVLKHPWLRFQEGVEINGGNLLGILLMKEQVSEYVRCVLKDLFEKQKEVIEKVSILQIPVPVV